MKTMISQPMYFPWCGLINQISLCDVYVNYDDVQLSRGFYNRVQVKRPNDIKFITIPIKNKKQHLLIKDALISYDEDWVNHHRAMLDESFKQCKYKEDAIEIFDKVHQTRSQNLSELSFKSITEILKYLGLLEGRKFLNSSQLNLDGNGSQRLLDITKRVGSSVYITGHGAFNYLDHSIFESEGIDVRYMKYNIQKYDQSHGAFTPFVTSLDAIAHLGKEAIKIFQSSTIRWNQINCTSELI